MNPAVRSGGGTLAIALACGVAVLLGCGPVLGAVNCTVSWVGVAFAAYHAALTSPDDATGSLTVTCTRLAGVDPSNVSFALGLSRGASGSYAMRRMASGQDWLDYNLYTDSARSQVWGDGSASTSPVSGSLPYLGSQTSNSVTYPIYGRAPAQQDVKHGNYSDSIVVTITF